jgi:hypothetical protein
MTVFSYLFFISMLFTLASETLKVQIIFEGTSIVSFYFICLYLYEKLHKK